MMNKVDGLLIIHDSNELPRTCMKTIRRNPAIAIAKEQNATAAAAECSFDPREWPSRTLGT